MIGREHRMSTTDPRSRAVLARDAALARVRRTRRWVIAGTAALTAGFAALVAALTPGRSLASKSPAATEVASASGGSATRARSASSVPQLPPAANPDSLGLRGPSQPPQAASSPSQSQSASPQPQSQSASPQPQSQSAPSSPQSSAPAQSTPPAAAPQPAPQPSGGGGVVSGGS